MLDVAGFKLLSKGKRIVETPDVNNATGSLRAAVAADGSFRLLGGTTLYAADNRSDDETVDGSVDSELGDRLNTLAVGNFLYQQGLGKIILVVGAVGSGKSTFSIKFVGERDPETGDYVLHFNANDRPEGQRVDSRREPVPVQRARARELGLAVLDTEGWDSLDNDTIQVVDRTLDALKTQPCVLFLVVRFGRLEAGVSKRVKLLRFCTGLTSGNCFLVLTCAEQRKMDGTVAKTARQRDPTDFVTSINSATRIDPNSSDLFVVGDNVACVDHDLDTEVTMEEICDKMVRFTPIRAHSNYSEMRDELTRAITRIDAKISQLDQKVTGQRKKLSECEREKSTLVELGLREKAKHDRLTRDNKVSRSFVDAAQRNSDLVAVGLDERMRGVFTRRLEIAQGLARLEACAQKLVDMREEKKERVRQWRSLADDVGAMEPPSRRVRFG